MKQQKDKDISKRSAVNTSVSAALLDSYRKALYEVEKFYRSVDFDAYGEDIELKIKVMAAVLSAGERIGKNIESLDKLEDKVKREERESITRRGGSETSIFEEQVMTPEQFTYWLQGFVEINGNPPTPEQWQIIKDHIQTVFHKVTPVRDDVITIPTNWPNYQPTIIC